MSHRANIIVDYSDIAFVYDNGYKSLSFFVREKISELKESQGSRQPSTTNPPNANQGDYDDKK